MTANELLAKIPSEYSDVEIEASLVSVFLMQKNISPAFYNIVLTDIMRNSVPELCHRIKSTGCKLTLKLIENVFEAMVDDHEKRENGVVFTPSYIVDYIIENSMNGYASENCRIIDPACGSGSFLVLAAEHLVSHIDKPINRIVSENIFGIDISVDNVRRSKILLSLLVLSLGYSSVELTFNIKATDSLKVSWNDLFECEDFDYILGNPPYVNTHDMSKETIFHLKKSFCTTQKGTFNIFYAFVEQSMKFLADDGALGFILPNNYLTITAAEILRKFLSDNQYVSKIIDFGENMIFAPVRTYNSLLFLDKKKNNTISYATIEKSADVAGTLKQAQLLTLASKDLDPAGWKLLTTRERQNIKNIEQAGTPLKSRIRVGIATLCDNIYLLDGYDVEKKKYYKNYEDTRYYIEPEVVRGIYKISAIKVEESLLEAKKYIIFPYTSIFQTSLIDGDNNAYQIIDEKQFSYDFPSCYQYLSKCRSILDERDKGKPNSVAWYAYGRSQGLGYSCKKLLFPTFSNKPKFMFEDSKNTLFCNGYAIIGSTDYPLEHLQKILNSSVMDYYISLTSYSIEGNYKCYQKKYIQNFSIPEFDSNEICFLSTESSSKLIDEFLFNKYQILV